MAYRRIASRGFAFGSSMMALGMALHTPAFAQDGDSANPTTDETATEQAAQAGRDDGTLQSSATEIIVTASKKGDAERVLDVPFAVTAFGAENLAERQVRNLQTLSYAMPNVQLESIGTTAGIANFSIRGLGINSSIPSIEPTVGVFIDGMYLGVNAGVVFDNFDLAGIEVLRGPQGTLYGRNTTGGAVLIRTNSPSDELTGYVRANLETGLNKIFQGSISGPLGGGLSAKLAAYYQHDDGWFTNLFDNSEFGRSEQWVVRPALRYEDDNGFEAILRYEHGKATGDGPAVQNHAFFDRDTFDFAIDFRGSYDNVWDQVILELNKDVAFGDGRITNIAGYRKYDGVGQSDIDGTTNLVFHTTFTSANEQFSNELRYTGTFGAVELTAGVYYFTQDVTQVEQRNLPAAGSPSGGGIVRQEALAAFINGDIALSDTLTANLGLRVGTERKEAEIATFAPGVCPELVYTSCAINFTSKDRWTDVGPKIGLTWKPGYDTTVYGFWARGFRSGGYNLRASTPAVPPGPFDQERQDSFEIGAKQGFGRGSVISVAAFYNKLKDLQREINLPSSATGVAQAIRNTADATIKGVEGELFLRLNRNFALTGSVGYLDGSYDEILLDLTGDRVIDAADFALQLPRLSPWTYGVGAQAEFDVGAGELRARADFNHRDKAFYTDNNRGFFNAFDNLDLSVSYEFDTGLRLAAYGRNVLNEVQFGGNTLLPPVPPFGGPGATFSPLNKGRVWGAEIGYSF